MDGGKAGSDEAITILTPNALAILPPFPDNAGNSAHYSHYSPATRPAGRNTPCNRRHLS